MFTATGSQISAQLLNNIQAGLDLFSGIDIAQLITSAGELLGKNIGDKIGSGIVDITSTGQAMLASLGSNAGSAFGIGLGESVATGIGDGIASSAIGGTILADVSTAIGDLILPGVGALIGAALGDAAGAEIYSFLNDITGGLFDRIFGSDTWQYLSVELNATNTQLQYGEDSTKNTTASIRDGTYSLTNAYLGTFNNVASMIGGQIDPATFNASPNAIIAYINDPSLSWSGDDYQVEFGNASLGYVNEAGDPAKIVRLATEYELYKTTFIGGDANMIRAFNAWKASVVNPESGADLPALMSDLQVAQDYERYQSAPGPINALIVAEPDSVFSTGWIATLLQWQGMTSTAEQAYTQQSSADLAAGDDSDAILSISHWLEFGPGNAQALADINTAYQALAAQSAKVVTQAVATNSLTGAIENQLQLVQANGASLGDWQTLNSLYVADNDLKDAAPAETHIIDLAPMLRELGTRW